MKIDVTVLDDEGKTFVGSAELLPRSAPARVEHQRGAALSVEVRP